MQTKLVSVMYQLPTSSCKSKLPLAVVRQDKNSVQEFPAKVVLR